jgi:hypothetical protein
MAACNDIWVKLGAELVEFAMYDWRDNRDAAVSDGMDFLERTRDDIERWCKMLEEGTYSRVDFAALLAEKKDLAGLALLRRRGLSRADLDRFMNGLIDTVVSTVCHCVCKK